MASLPDNHTPMASRYATHVFHSLIYYKKLLLALRGLLVRGLSHKAIAAVLNARGLKSPTGQAFDAPIVKSLLWGLRNPLESRSNLHRAMTHLFFNGELTREQCMPLITMRAGTQP